MTKRDYYDILGIKKDAKAQEIKRAYRKLAKKHHPDVCKEADAEEKFKEVSEAYEILIDPNKRANYDQFGHAGAESVFGREGFKWSDFTHFGDIGDMFGGDFFGRDIFDVFFGGARRAGRPGPVKGNDLRYDLYISLEEAATAGVKTELHVPRTERCDECNGSGAKQGTSPKTCPVCNGSGQERRARRTPLGQFVSVTTCGRCHGEGRIIENPCSSCNGTGRMRHTRKISVKIPRGVDTGSHLRISGEGDSGARGGPSGDLYVVIHINPHEFFKRDGDDLFCEVHITFSQAALGDEIEVPTLKGKARLKIPPGTQTGTIFRLRGEGIPHLRRTGRGDQNVRAVIVTPKGLGKREKKLFKELAEMESNGSGIKGSIGKMMNDVKDAFT